MNANPSMNCPSFPPVVVEGAGGWVAAPQKPCGANPCPDTSRNGRREDDSMVKCATPFPQWAF